MPKAAAPRHPTVHLAIDVQTRYIQALSRERQRQFPAAIRAFADRLREHGVPTVWITLLDRFKFHPRRMTWGSNNASLRRWRQLQKFGLDKIAARRDEDIFTKRTNNAFEKLLSERLRSYGTSTVIVTGMNTRWCVAATVCGAVRTGLNCLVVTDRLADMTAHESFDQDPDWHRRTIERALAKAPLRKDRSTARLGEIEFRSCDDVLGAYGRTARGFTDSSHRPSSSGSSLMAQMRTLNRQLLW